MLSRRFFDGFQYSNCPLVTIIEDDTDENFRPGGVLFPATAVDASQYIIPIDKSGDDIDFNRIVAGPPEKYRSAMILSYLEGFSNAEPASLADVPPEEVELPIDRGNEFMHDKIFTNLRGNIGFASN